MWQQNRAEKRRPTTEYVKRILIMTGKLTLHQKEKHAHKKSNIIIFELTD